MFVSYTRAGRWSIYRGVKRYDTGEVVLNYAEGPNNGPPFVILPGYYHGWQNYKSLITTLKAQYHLYAVDARGTGKSGRTPGRYKLKHSVEDMWHCSIG